MKLEHCRADFVVFFLCFHQDIIIGSIMVKVLCYNAVSYRFLFLAYVAC